MSSPSHQSPIGSYSDSEETPSLEHLVPKSRTAYLRFVRKRERDRKMGNTESNGGVQIEERRKSYGIGGAGNIRRPSEVIYPPRVNAGGTRRRSSVWSTMSISPGSSPDGRRVSILNLFARKGSLDEGAETNTDVNGNRNVDRDGEGERKVEFKDVDLNGKEEGEN